MATINFEEPHFFFHSARNAYIFKCLYARNQKSHQGKLTKFVVILHDSARRQVQDLFSCKHLAILNIWRSPPKQLIRWELCNSHAEIELAVSEWFHSNLRNSLIEDFGLDWKMIYCI